MYVYVEHFGYFWKLPFKVWVGICRDGAEGRPYQLPEKYSLTRRPRSIEVIEDQYQVSYFSRTYDLVSPLDWGREDFRDWLAMHQIE